jgi:predicted nucleotidyltransferase
MHKALELRKSERQEALRIAARYVARLQKMVNKPVSAILYGSFARGDFNAGSDVDVIVICDALPSHPLRRMDLLYDSIEGGIEPKGYTRKEFAEIVKSGKPFGIEILRDGVVLLDDGFLKSLSFK